MKLLPPPGPARTRQLSVLAIVLIAAVVAWRFQAAGSDPPATARPAGGTAAASNTRSSPPTTEPTRSLPQPVQLEKLQANGEEPSPARNPFRFGVPPAPPPKPQVERPPVVAPAPAVPQGPPPPPPITLKFIGRVVLPDKRLVAALSDTKGGVFEATEGQIIDGRIRVVKIGEESAIVEYVNGTGRTTLGLK
jgi:hypothetical protein